MGVRVLGGFGKGILLNTADDSILRPTSIQLKRAVYDANQNLDGSFFIDFFAGIGSVGIEGISRGAIGALFLEKNNSCFKTLQKNILCIKESFAKNHPDDSKIMFDISHYCTDCSRFAWEDFLEKKFSKIEKIILFVDPPYELHDSYVQILNAINHFIMKGSYKKFGITVKVWVESDIQKGPSLQLIEKQLNKNATKVYTHSSHFISTFNFP